MSKLQKKSRVKSQRELFFVALLMSLLAAGCSHDSKEPAPASTVAWSWDAYPTVEKMRLATLPCRILPKASLTINAPISGQLRLYIDRPQTNLPAGFVWAEFEPKSLNLEAAELTEARQRIEERERLFQEIELPKEKIKLNKEIAEAQRQVALLRLLSTNSDLAQLAISAPGLNKEGVLKPESLQQAEDELALMERNLKYLSSTNPAILEGDLQATRMELERRQLEFDRRQAQARFKMPFAGQLIASLQLADGVTEYPVSAGQELAVVRDLNAVLLRIPLEEVSWTTLPTEKLSALLHLPDGALLEANFAFKKLERFQLREELCYYFQFPAGDAVSAGSLVGADISCELWLGLAQPARIVPKLTLVLQQPAAFQNRHWSEGLAQVLPGAQVLIEGQTDLAILPPVDGHKDKLDGHGLLRAQAETIK